LTEVSRCPNCGALVAVDADWCGQCFTSFRTPPASAPDPEPEPGPGPEAEPWLDALTETPALSVAPGLETSQAPIGQAADEGRGPLPVWECPACGTENPFDGQVCSACGTSFGRLFDEREASTVATPRDAAFAGMVPGVGHYRMGRHADGVVRMLVSVGCLLVLGLFAFSASGKASAAITALFALLLLLCIGESSYDAARLASDQRELVSAAQLIWLFLGAFGFAVATVFLMGRTPVSP